MPLVKEKKCTVCKKVFPYTANYFYACGKTKSGLAAKCKVCSNQQAKIYMRKIRIARRLKQCRLYDGRLSKIDLAKLDYFDLVDMLYEVSRQLLYSASNSRFCTKCEQFHISNHKKP